MTTMTVLCPRCPEHRPMIEGLRCCNDCLFDEDADVMVAWMLRLAAEKKKEMTREGLARLALSPGRGG